VEANGSHANYGSGGGGAVSIEYNTSSASGVPWSVTARTNTSNNGASRQGGAGTLYVKRPTSTYGDLSIDNKGFTGEQTLLPSLGFGVIQPGSGGPDVVTDKTADIPAYFVGHWVEISTAGGVLKGTWRIGSISGKTMTLAPNAGETIDVQSGDTWQGVYRFDNVTLRTTKVLSADPLRSTTAPDLGSTILDINDGPPKFPTAKQSQIVVDNSTAGDAVVGPIGAVTDAQTPIKLTVTNTRTTTTSPVVNANADGSFRVPVTGQPGDTFTIFATDSHTLPLNSATIAVNGSIVETNAIASLTIAPSTVTGGTSVNGSLRLTAPARSGGATVTLSRSGSVATVPASVVVPAGNSTVQFPITTSSPATQTEAQITASIGASVKTANLTVTPVSAALADVALSASTIEGGTSVNGTVVLGAAAPEGGALVMLAASSPSVSVPANVLVPEGNLQASFSVTTSKVGALTKATITATWGASDSAPLDLTACSAMGTAAQPSSTTMSTVWINDAAPAGAATAGEAAFDTTQSALGSMALHFAPPTTTQLRTFSITGAAPLAVTPINELVLYALVNPCNPPRQVLVTWSDGTTQWRASFGESRIDPTLAQTYAGALPRGGEWTRLALNARTLGITSNKNVTALTISVDGGEAWFDAIGANACSFGRAAQPTYLPNETVWFDEALPAGATMFTAYNWNNTQSASGTVSDLVTSSGGEAQHYFTGATDGLKLNVDDVIVAYVLVDPCNPPSEIMFQFDDGSQTWSRRVYWGDDRINWGAINTVEHRRLGAMPEAGKWVRLEIPVSSMLMTGTTVRGISFYIYDGRAWFDRIGKASRVNLALGKPAAQSSLLQNDPTYKAGAAVDGNTVNYSHTLSENQPSWEVDLGSVQPIDSIDVWNLVDCCGGPRVKQFYVFVSDQPFASTALSTTLTQDGVSAYYYLIVADRPTSFEINRTGRYVRIQLTGANFLHLSEVNVWAPVTPGPGNVAGGRKASQSSTLSDSNGAYLAEQAVNGSAMNSAMSHTTNEAAAWWQVDLGVIQPIGTIDIDNVFPSSVTARMSNFYLYVSDGPFTSNTVAATLAQSGVSAYYRGPASAAYTYQINRTGRFIRLQLTGTNWLHPKELKVWAPSLPIGALAKSPEKF
jgi:hypothetical protein